MNPQNRYALYHEIGNGSFGKVYLAEDTITKRKVAIKRMEKSKIVSNPYLLKAFWKEIEIMKKCKCKNSVEFIELIQSQNNFNVIMELCDLDLHQYLFIKPTGLSTEEIRKILLQLNNVFQIIYSQKIMHRDLKLKNIMLKYLNSEKTEYEVKLSDYGFSKALDENLITNTHLGTPVTMAPEVLSNKYYSFKADLWSVGVIIYQLIFKELPYFALNEEKVLEKILSRTPIKQCNDVVLRDLINKLLVVDPEKRIGWNEYFTHPFFNQVVDFNYNNFNYINNGFNNFINCIDKYEKYSKIKEFSFGIDIKDFKIFIGKENSSNLIFYIKQYSKSFANKHIQQIKNEINLCNLFQFNKHAIQFYKLDSDNNYTYLLFKYEKGESLYDYSQKNDIDENKLRKINLDFYENLALFINVNQIQFNILSIYNFIVNQNGELILFDFGLINFLLPEEIKKEYFITSLNEMNQISGKSSILNYGITLYKIYFKDEKNIEINNNIIKIPNNKPISKELISFLSKCIYRNIEKRHSWNSFPLDSFLYSSLIDNNNSILIDKSKLEIILTGLEYRFQFIVDYYNSIDFSEKNSRTFLNEIGQFLTISFIELKTIRKIFDKCIRKDNNFSSEEEISFLQINKQSKYHFITYNLGSISKNKKIFSEDTNDLLIAFMEKTKSLLSSIIKIIIKIKKIDKNVCQLGENSNTFIKKLLDSFKKSNIQNYFYNLTQEGIQLFEIRDLKKSNQKFTIAEFLSEYIIFMKTFMTDNNKNINNFNLINKFFNSEEQIYITTILMKEEKEKYLFVSFLGGMFRYYYNQINKEGIKLIENEKYMNYAFDGLIQFYPSLMKMVIDSKEIK